ncbi:DUF2969 family protein [Convivina intestini]|uniref:DUF2969 family protein n=1 Tax=Convivina intestini TaxID=1505726 RepID=A0A2U1D3S8_9LACO|nr:DUF2969 family protein [Convivina intestini]PVY82336.1 hypothetical protein C7384_11413 [Convivina intestini]CAH1857326.1 hypothetical protein R078131_01584 [Convivina intestini]CAH1857447.1 hypothetical protein R077811_01509 [Convivina intestini]SDC18574.1 Protein of unknown function [Leuconostocaceae bacterium R-53105]
MSKKNQNFTVTLSDEENQTQVKVNDNLVGIIQKNGDIFVGFVGEQRVISSAASVEEALNAILANYNLYH